MTDQATSSFANRHLGLQGPDLETALDTVGVSSLDDLVADALPDDIRQVDALDLPPPLSEQQAIEALRTLASKNRVLTSMIGQGYSDTITPPVLLRNVLENPAWYTAYTPYQPEISQGRLEVLLNFQTMVSDLTGMEIANASLLDEATAAAEAMAMCLRLSKVKGKTLLVDAGCHPQTISVIQTRARPLGVDLQVTDLDAATDLDGVFGVVMAFPSTTGGLVDRSDLVERAKAAGAITVAVADLLALTLIEPPGSWGVDIVVGSSQRFGVPLGFGGPHAGFIATRDKMARSLPGRLVGVSTDAEGRTAYRLALQTREQHIRREKATSNVCTAQVLLAVLAGLYASWHGPEGLQAIAQRVHDHATSLARGLEAAGFTLVDDTWFDTISVQTDDADGVIARAREAGINLRAVGPSVVGVACDEVTDLETVATVAGCFSADVELEEGGTSGIPDGLRRVSPYLTHEVFHRYRTEHEMLRYLRRLSDKDLALDRTMIPLGSCTMKLNATTEMMPITWPEFARVHPFAPLEQVEGYLELIDDLERWLCELTGYDAMSLQPNAGSQGEYAGLLAIQAYHAARGNPERDVVLIPSSAHGTNAASAAMVGLRVVVVACDDRGDVDLADLEVKAKDHSDRLAAAMVTYPSTHGVFEESIARLCEIVHEHGGQVYVDGANLNALVGLARPGRFGADVSHLNLHKTFTIPHGGGGPGVGPVGVRAHLAPFLPGHEERPSAGPDRSDVSGAGAVSAAPWGSAGILAISWTYLAMMGATGLTEATKRAILAANYLATRLNGDFPILYTGETGRVAHECIVDLRGITRDSGVTAEDVAKRLADYEFHAPTLSFPVAGTLMIEPTESETLAELDRFCEAMISIRHEIAKVEDGTWPADDNPLVHAPHPVANVATDDWEHPYPRSVAAFPAGPSKRYFPPVSRIDGAYGDRHLVCACPPIEAYVE